MKKLCSILATAGLALLIGVNPVIANTDMSNRYDVPPATFEMELSEGLYLADANARRAISTLDKTALGAISTLDETRAWGQVYDLAIPHGSVRSTMRPLLSTSSGPVFIDILIPSAGANWVQGTVTVIGTDGTHLTGNFSNFVNDFNSFFFQGSAGVTYIFFIDVTHVGTGAGVYMLYAFSRE